MLKVYTGEVLALVEIMKNVLEMHNIESFIRNQYLSAAVGETSNARKKLLKRLKEILRNHKKYWFVQNVERK